MIKLPLFMLLWVGMICIKIPTALFGFFVVPFLYPYRDTDYKDLPWWTRPWSNPEDWTGQPGCYESSLPRWWVEERGTGFGSFYRYYAVQNSANGLRSFEFLDLTIDPSKVKYKTNYKMTRYEPPEMRELGLKTVWYWAWQGFQAGFKIIHIWNDERHLVIKLGWRVEPEDASGGDKYFKIGMEDASFAGKVLLYRKG